MRLQVLYGLPHRPWHADYPGNTQIGRFIKHISILKCEACAKDSSYIAGEVGVVLVPASIIYPTSPSCACFGREVRHESGVMALGPWLGSRETV